MAIDLLFLPSFHRPFRSSPQTLMGLQTAAWKPLALNLNKILWGLLGLISYSLATCEVLYTYESVSKMLPDEDGGAQLWCWLLFGQVWRMPVQSSDRSGPQHCNCWSTSSCSLLPEGLEKHYSQQSWGTILFAESSFCCYSLKARRWPGTSIAVARIRPLHTLEWQVVLPC